MGDTFALDCFAEGLWAELWNRGLTGAESRGQNHLEIPEVPGQAPVATEAAPLERRATSAESAHEELRPPAHDRSLSLRAVCSVGPRSVRARHMHTPVR